MRNNCPTDACALCGAPLPRGVRVALFADADADTPVLGDFCSVAHAFGVLDDMTDTSALPDTLVLGVRVDRQGHDEVALASIMAEMVRRAVRAALADDAIFGSADAGQDDANPTLLN
jgi:hypothetical protein